MVRNLRERRGGQNRADQHVVVRHGHRLDWCLHRACRRLEEFVVFRVAKVDRAPPGGHDLLDRVRPRETRALVRPGIGRAMLRGNAQLAQAVVHAVVVGLGV